ncbi:MAG TPA: DUF2334 domain-containing protein [Candidatus Methanofastidiosa archaeon]|nr:DUF2334 domain-containing protein [Candidatus Methanofastidiosa archaeon]
MIRRRYLFILFLIILVSSYLYTINVQRYFSPFSSYWDPFDLDNEYCSIGRFPSGNEGVAILTIDDVSYMTSAEEIQMIMELTEKYQADVTYFIIPRYGGEERTLSQNQELIEALNEALSQGDEMALHGYIHYPTMELKGKSYDEQLSIISSGKEDLESLFGEIYGFRPPSFWKNTNTYKALEEAGFQYCSSASIFNVFPYNPKDTFHPFFGDDIDIIEIPCFPEDYFWDVTPENSSTVYHELTTRFDACLKKGTPFLVFTHLPRLMAVNEITGRYEALEMMERFLEHANENNIWMPTIHEYLEWYNMLSGIEVDYKESLNELLVTITSEENIDGLTLYFDLPDIIDTIYIYYNGDNIYTKLDCASDEVITL